MATGSRRHDPTNTVRLLGNYTLIDGGHGAARVTIPTALDSFQFPTDVGETVRLELHNPSSDDEHLRLYPIDE